MLDDIRYLTMKLFVIQLLVCNHFQLDPVQLKLLKGNAASFHLNTMAKPTQNAPLTTTMAYCGVLRHMIFPKMNINGKIVQVQLVRTL